MALPHHFLMDASRVDIEVPMQPSLRLVEQFKVRRFMAPCKGVEQECRETQAQGSQIPTVAYGPNRPLRLDAG